MRWVLLATTLGACAPITEAPVTGEPEIKEFGGGMACRAEGLARFVGQPATAELGTAARDAAGARTVRWLQPGTIVTMDYRDDRLNIQLDGENRVTRLACG